MNKNNRHQRNEIPKIIGLVGEKFAGKDEAANFLVRKYNAFHVRFSHIFDDILRILDISISRENEIKLGNAIRREFGEGVFVPAIIKRLKQNEGRISAVNGIRLKEEYEALEKIGAVFVYITAPPEIRYERYTKRKEKIDDGSLNFNSFLKVEEGHTEALIPKLGKGCEYKIENEGSLEDFFAKVEEVSAKIFATRSNYKK